MLLRSRLLVILVILSVLLLSPWGSVLPVSAKSSAQSNGCIAGLSAAECTLFKTASAATLPNTFELGYNLNIVINSASPNKRANSQPTHIEVGVTGTGPFDSSRVKGKSLPSIVKGIVLSNEGTLSYKIGKQSASQPLDIRFVDSTLYINTPISMGTDGLWYKLPLDPFMKDDSITFDTNSLEQFVRPDSFLFGLGSVVLPDANAQVKAGPTMDGLVTYQATMRLDVGKLYDQMMGFQREMILQSFFGSMMQSSGQKFDFSKDPQLKAAAERFLRSMKIDLSWYAEPKGKTLRGFGFAISFSIDPKIGKMWMPTLTLGQTDVTVDMQFTYSKFGQAVKVEAPKGAIDLSPYFQNKAAA
jgi:hypothetical protein